MGNEESMLASLEFYVGKPKNKTHTKENKRKRGEIIYPCVHKV
jgi:hypothetical protein